MIKLLLTSPYYDFFFLMSYQAFYVIQWLEVALFLPPQKLNIKCQSSNN